MLYNVVVKNEMRDGNLVLHILFNKPIENKEQFLVVTTSATVAYFLQKVKTDLLVDDKDIYFKEDIIAQVTMNEKTIDVVFYVDKLKLIDKKLNPMTLFIGVKAYYNIYFNLYQNNEYYKIEEYYQTIRK